MDHPTPKLISTLHGQAQDIPPIWLMRQAGRYLPEYREVRKQAGDFLNLCYSPELAARVTLQPIERFGFDAAILFSDILVIPDALGQNVSFKTGEGPVLEPIEDPKQIAELNVDGVLEHLSPVFEAISRIRAELPPHVALIGFCGAPWTVATYMIEGGGSKDHARTRAFAYTHPEAFAQLMDILVEASSQYLIHQVAAGAQALQIFDSWAGALTAKGFEDWAIQPAARIISRVRAAHPNIPLIGFPRGAGEKLERYAAGTLADAVALDTGYDPQWVHRNLPKNLPVQGNIDPALMLGGGDALAEAVLNIRRGFAGRPHVFNLGHGITPQADIERVHELMKLVRTPLKDLMAG